MSDELKNKCFVFAGNRAFVFEKMVGLGLNIKEVFAVKGSFLERYLAGSNIAHRTIDDRNAFIEALDGLKFDYFIANGLPVILPVTRLTAGNGRHFVNVHPSVLPDLRGADPVPGALLFNRQSGATCHYMDDGIDTGPIIAQVTINNTPDLDAGLLYQLSFAAEAEVFEKAANRIFKIADDAGPPTVREIYYTYKEPHLKIDWREDVESVIRRVRAFSTAFKGAFFEFQGRAVKVLAADLLVNDYAGAIAVKKQDMEVVFRYENYLVIKKDGSLLRLRVDAGSASFLPGTILEKNS